MRLRQILPTAALITGVALLAVGGVAAATSGHSSSVERSGQMMGGGEVREMHRQHMRDPQMREMHRQHMRDPQMREMHRQHMRDPQRREMHRELMSSESPMGSMHRR